MPPRKRPPGNEEQGKALREARDNAGVTQLELAQLLGHKKRDIIIDIEHGRVGFYEDEERKVNDYLKARQEDDKPILSQPTTRLSMPDLKAKYSEENNWVDFEHGIPYIAIFPLMDQSPKFLTKKQVKGMKLSQQQFRVPPEKLPESVYKRIIPSYKQLDPDVKIYDERKVRIVEATYNDKRSELTLGYARATFEDNLITHRLLDYRLLSTEEKPLEEPTALRDIFAADSGDGHLPPLGFNSPLANTTGRGGLVITRDHHLVLVLRSRAVAADAGMYDLSVQGSADIDTETPSTYDVFRDFRHEALDELGIEMRSGWEWFSQDEEAIYLMGLVRSAASAGKPDFLFLGKTTYTSDEVLENAPKAKDEWEHEFPLTLPPTTTISELRTRLSPTSRNSVGLRGAIALLTRLTDANGLGPQGTIKNISEVLFGRH